MLALCRLVILGPIALMASGIADPAIAQQAFRDRNYRVRVCVSENVEQLALRGDGGYQILSSGGVPLGNLVGGRPYFVQITRGQPGGHSYRLVLHELDGHLDRDAVRLGVEARDRHGLPVKVLRLPARGDRESRIIVTVGEFESAAQAQQSASGLEGVTIEYIYEDRAVAREGQVRLLGEQGSILAHDPRHLKLVPLNARMNSLSVLEVEDDSWSHRQLGQARHYRGDIELVINEQGTLSVVNDLWIEYYLYSVVPAEIGPGSPEEALKTQSVVARTWAVARIQSGVTPSTFFDFHDTAMFQVYRGKGDEVEPARRAVDATRGEILVHDGEVIDAVYSHSCGGVISTMTEVWGGTLNAGWSVRRFDRLDSTPPALGSAAAVASFTGSNHDSFCNPSQAGFPAYARGNFRWTRTLSGPELSDQANRLHGVGTVREISVARRAASGRVQELRIVGDRRTVQVRGEQSIRRVLGIRSTLFHLIPATDGQGRVERLTVQGAGWGHGAGMCQMGALTMARRGYQYRQILGHYYGQVRIRQLYR